MLLPSDAQVLLLAVAGLPCHRRTGMQNGSRTLQAMCGLEALAPSGNSSNCHSCLQIKCFAQGAPTSCGVTDFKNQCNCNPGGTCTNGVCQVSLALGVLAFGRAYKWVMPAGERVLKVVGWAAVLD